MLDFGIDKLERVNQILHNQTYLELIKQIEEAESDRIYCRHNMEHFLNVARIAEIINLKEKLDLDMELVYATALLHDIGRRCELDTGERHELASGRLAPDIVRACGFNEIEEKQIVSAILNHRNSEIAKATDKPLDSAIYRADKLSRNCFYCIQADADCHKTEEKKNLELNI